MKYEIKKHIIKLLELIMLLAGFQAFLILLGFALTTGGTHFGFIGLAIFAPLIYFILKTPKIKE